MNKYEKLIEQWEEDIKTYPNHEIGRFCQATLQCCINELKEILVGSKRVKMPTIEISEELMKYIKDGIFGDAGEAWYTAGISVDMKDYDSFLKHLANNFTWERAFTLDQPLEEHTPFPEVQYKETKPRVFR